MSAVRSDLLDRFFIDHGDHYEVVKEIRSRWSSASTTWASARLPADRLALCRNVLIYFTGELQKRALQLFAFSLREGGYLVLGRRSRRRRTRSTSSSTSPGSRCTAAPASGC